MQKQVGKIGKFFSKISVAVIEPTEELCVGDTIIIRGSGNVEMTIDSMQIDHKNVASATKSFGLKTLEPVKEGDLVYKVDGE